MTEAVGHARHGRDRYQRQWAVERELIAIDLHAGAARRHHNVAEAYTQASMRERNRDRADRFARLAEQEHRRAAAARQRADAGRSRLAAEGFDINAR